MSEGSDNGSEFIRKKVDESWKDTVSKEKTLDPAPAPAEPPAAEFIAFISTLAMQCLMALGEVAHPASDGQLQTDLPQAQYLIDIIQMLAEKTKSNVPKEETAEIQTLLYQLRMKFVKKSQGVPS